MVSDAAVGHRVQPELLDFDNLADRARLVGETFAELRLRPFRQEVRVASAFKRSPGTARIFCAAAWIAWSLRGVLSSLMSRLSDRWREERLVSIERRAYFRSLLRVASECSDYKVTR